MKSDRLLLMVGAAVFVGLNALVGAEPETNWPQFRGTGGRGVGGSAALPEHWGTAENVAWKAEIPGRGWSSPIVWGDRIFLTTAISSGQTEPAKKGLYFGGER